MEQPAGTFRTVTGNGSNVVPMSHWANMPHVRQSNTD